MRYTAHKARCGLWYAVPCNATSSAIQLTPSDLPRSTAVPSQMPLTALLLLLACGPFAAAVKLFGRRIGRGDAKGQSANEFVFLSDRHSAAKILKQHGSQRRDPMWILESQFPGAVPGSENAHTVARTQPSIENTATVLLPAEDELAKRSGHEAFEQLCKVLLVFSIAAPIAKGIVPLQYVPVLMFSVGLGWLLLLVQEDV
jgi:hypothetical protein